MGGGVAEECFDGTEGEGKILKRIALVDGCVLVMYSYMYVVLCTYGVKWILEGYQSQASLAVNPARFSVQLKLLISLSHTTPN